MALRKGRKFHAAIAAVSAAGAARPGKEFHAKGEEVVSRRGRKGVLNQ
jgi:hypothetical protein